MILHIMLEFSLNSFWSTKVKEGTVLVSMLKACVYFLLKMTNYIYVANLDICFYSFAILIFTGLLYFAGC